ncbi:MAG: T9SS type A sorting domain-containing protein, partial [Sphingobacteriaceae bacterium]|nr:T9SS type A sorting domain-containing protein [Cytophagaceae bacterium]
MIYDTTRANGASDELEWRTVVIPNNGTYIQPGFNVIAAEVHQVTPGSSDLHFNMELIGTPDMATVPSGSRLAAPGPVFGAETAETVIFPNPASQKVYFSPPLTYQSFQLLDTRGVLLRSVSQPGTLRELDISTLPAGLYLLRSQGKEKAVQFKISKP